MKFVIKALVLLGLLLSFGLYYLNDRQGSVNKKQEDSGRSKVLIYTKSGCPYCIMAKNIFLKKGHAFEEINIAGEPELADEMYEKSRGRNTVPQIFINDRHVGGFDDLSKLEELGRLDHLLFR